jgi:uncharacterized membrane protein
MHRLLRVVHFVALAVFLGSVPGHILLGQLATADPAAAPALLRAKLAMIETFTLPGLAVLALSGAGLAIAARAPWHRRRWLVAKLALVLAVGANGALVLLPIARRQAELSRAAPGAPTEEFRRLEMRESVAGAANLVTIAGIIALAVYRPGFGAGRRAAEQRA